MDVSTSNQKRLGYETTPTELKQLKKWLIWQSVQKPGEPKPRKVPFYTNGRKRHGKQGGPEDRAALATFKAACQAAKQQGAAGVGLAMLEDNGLVGLDFDHCIADPLSGLIDERVRPLIANTYAEVSPSRTGIRAFYRGELPDGQENGDANELKLQVFHTKGYLTVTGNRLPDAPPTIAPLTDTVRDYWTRRRGSTATSAKSAEAAAPFIPEPHNCTLADVTEMLTHATAHRDDYEPWTHVLWSVERAKLGAQDGSNPKDWDALVVEWSSHSPKFVSAENVLNKMREAQTRAGLGIHYLEKIAREGGWPPTDEQEQRLGNISDPKRFPCATAEQDAAAKRSRFKLIPVDEFASGPEPEWIVEGVIPRSELGVIFGEPGCGKSFFALDLALSIARGVPWRGRNVKQGRVLYISAESASGFRQRLKAYANEHGIKLSDLSGVFFMLAEAPNLMVKKDVDELIRQIQAKGDFAFVVIDTLARATPGANKNSGEDMGAALANCKVMHKVSTAFVQLVHHSGKDQAKGARGWSGIRGAADTEIEITKLGNSRIRQAEISKQRDGEDGLKFLFTLELVAAGVNAKGQEVTSLVVRPAEIAASAVAKVRLPTSLIQRAVWNVLASAQRGMQLEELITPAAGRLLRDPANKSRDRRRDLAKQAIERMLEVKMIVERNGFYYLAGQTEFPDATAQSKADGIKVDTSLAAVTDTLTRAAINNRDDLVGAIRDH